MAFKQTDRWVKFMSFAVVFAFLISAVSMISVGSDSGDNQIFTYTEESNSSSAYIPGTEWVKDGIVLDVGAVGEEKNVMTPSVLKLSDGTYAMWYQGLGTDGHQRIMKAVSGDGLAWTRCGIALDYGEQYAESGVMFPFVMVDDTGLYHMWYSGYNYKWRAILHATSADGTTWTKHGAELFYGSSFDLDGVASPRVHYDGAQWHMWYSGVLWNPLRDTICHAHKASLSDHWIKDGTVLANDGEFDNPIAWSPYILDTEAGYEMFYGGRSPDQYPGRICHAHSADGLAWTKTGIAVDRSLPGESQLTDFPFVLPENGGYRMWYVGYDGVNSRIYHAHISSAQENFVDISVNSEGMGVSDPAPVSGTPLIITANIQGDVSTASEWVKHGVVLDLGGWGEDQQVGGPCVLRADNGTYLMFYLGKEYDGTTVNYRIFRAFSHDGLEWHKQGMVLNYGGAYAGNSVYHPYVWIAPDGTYHMWYAGQNYEGGNRARILHATSPDGFNFVYDGLEIDYGSAIEPASVNTPFVMPDGDGYRMWYTGTAWSPLKNLINHAHKTNLADAWVKDGTVLQNNGVYDNPHAQRPWVLKTETGYEMFYSGTDAAGITRILHATSADGLTWVRDGIVIEPTLPLEGSHTRWCSVLAEDGIYRMWYTGLTANNRIFYAEKAPGHQGLDAACTVSFYMDSVAPENLIESVENVFVPADGQTPVSIDWVPVAGEHEIIVVIDNTNPTDSDVSNNIASITINVIDSGNVDLSIASERLSLSSTEPTTGEPVTITANVLGDRSVSSEWVKHGTVLDLGGWGEDLRVGSPCVLNMPNGTYLMFYSAKANDGFSTSLYYRIFRAFSYDGIEWHKQGMVLNYGGPYAGNAVYNPNVWIAPDGIYHMWYLGQNPEDGNRGRILHATSPDGFNFIYDKMELNFGSSIQPDGVDNPFVICDEGILKMWYVGTTWSPSAHRINYAFKSSVSDPWTIAGTVLNNDGIYDSPSACKPSVLKSSEGYEMYYTGYDSSGTYRILKASSQDGIIWEKIGVVLEKSRPEEVSGVLYPNVLTIDNAYRMWYCSYNHPYIRINFAEKLPSHEALDATCTVSYYLDSVAPENLIESVNNVLVPADGQTTVSIDWTPVAGEHEIIVAVDGVNPTDRDISNNIAVMPVSVSDLPEPTSAELITEKVKLTGIDYGFTHTYYEWELQITVTNSGGSDALDVVVRDVLPAELELLEFLGSTGLIELSVYGETGTRAAPAPPSTQPVRSTHIAWSVGSLEPGQSETLYLKVCTRLNPAGKQEFTSPGTYIINEGAIAKGTDALTGGEIVSGRSSAVTVIIEDPGDIPDFIVQPPISKEPKAWFFMVMMFACFLPGYSRKH